MSAIVTSNFRINNAEQLKESFGEASPTNTYIFIGRTAGWPTDTDPPTPTRDINAEYALWREMIAAKKITSGDVSHVIPRNDWAANTQYSQYDDTDAGLSAETFFVVNSVYGVYKCLFNANSANSTTEPTGTGTSVITTADGYKWKYMYTISAGDAVKFLTPEWIPVKVIGTIDDGSAQWDVEQAAVDGAIDVILVTNAGIGYSSAPTLTISGNGANANAYAVISSGQIASVVVDSRGTGYSNASIAVTGGAGANGAVRAVIGPKGDHGYNAVYELFGYYVMLNSRLEYDESGKFTTSNDFRVLGLLKDPYTYGTSNVASGSVYRQSFTLNLANTTGTFVIDEIVTGATSGATGRIVEANSSIMRLINRNNANFVNNETLTGANSAATASANSNTYSELEPYSGRILYVENRKPVMRSSDQIESIHIVIET